MSKRPDLKVGVENNNKNQKLIKEEWIRKMIEVVVKETEGKDERAVKVVEEMKKQRLKC